MRCPVHGGYLTPRGLTPCSRHAPAPEEEEDDGDAPDAADDDNANERRPGGSSAAQPLAALEATLAKRAKIDAVWKVKRRRMHAASMRALMMITDRCLEEMIGHSSPDSLSPRSLPRR